MNEYDSQSKRPTEEQIEALLASWQPLPSTRLDRQVADLPWNQRGKTITRSQPVRWAGATLAILVLLAGVTLTTPSLRAMAAELLGFVNATSDTLEETITFVDPPAPLDSVAAVEAQASFDVREPTYLPSDFVFDNATYSDWKSTLLYYHRPGDAPEQGINISVAQWRYDPNLEQAEVGASANIENVSINGVIGQYVRGAWYGEAPPDPAPGTCNEGCVIEVPTPAPGETRNSRFHWNANVSMHNVRWQEGDMVYQLTVSGDQFTKEEVLKIAQSLR